MKITNKLGEVVIDLPEDLDYTDEGVIYMVNTLQDGVDSLEEQGFVIKPVESESIYHGKGISGD